MSVSHDTIFAISSGSPPAAIGLIRVSGPSAFGALRALTNRDFEPRRATLASLRRPDDEVLLDKAVVVWLPGPANATGEDCAELHCHGGRAVLTSVMAALGMIPGLREAQPGEFTRRAFANGRIDLAEAEGLADLLSAETELQRAAAMANASGALSRQIETWRAKALQLAAQVEAVLDFSDEDDVGELTQGFWSLLADVQSEITVWLERPRSERLGLGFRVALAGPPNVGKSTLFNALVESEAAITSEIAGTTRDLIERSVAIEGIPFVMVDTAGIREANSDVIEAMGIERAQEELARADLVLWLGPEGEGPDEAWEISPRCDMCKFSEKAAPSFRVSAITNEGIDLLKKAMVKRASELMPKVGEVALNARQHTLTTEACNALCAVAKHSDPLLIAEELRCARLAFDRLIGRATTEDMLDALFGRFCIGK